MQQNKNLNEIIYNFQNIMNIVQTFPNGSTYPLSWHLLPLMWGKLCQWTIFHEKSYFCAPTICILKYNQAYSFAWLLVSSCLADKLSKKHHSFTPLSHRSPAFPRLSFRCSFVLSFFLSFCIMFLFSPCLLCPLLPTRSLSFPPLSPSVFPCSVGY